MFLMRGQITHFKNVPLICTCALTNSWVLQVLPMLQLKGMVCVPMHRNDMICNLINMILYVCVHLALCTFAFILRYIIVETPNLSPQNIALRVSCRGLPTDTLALRCKQRNRIDSSSKWPIHFWWTFEHSTLIRLHGVTFTNRGVQWTMWAIRRLG